MQEGQKLTKSKRKTAEPLKISDAVAKLEAIQLGLKQDLSNLRKNLEVLDSQPELLSDLEDARREAELRASSLEAEVKQLREELKAIKDLLGTNVEKK